MIGAIPGAEGAGVYPVSAPQRLGEIRNVRVLPVLLGGFLALLATGAVGHALATAVRRRRHDLAVLRALDMSRRQCRGAIVTQATVLALVGLLFVHTRDVLGFEAAGLLAFGLAALLAAIVLVGQSVARHVAATVADLRVLRAAGMTPAQAAQAAVAGPFLAGLAGAAIGVGAAILASRWTSYGTAALHEPRPGIDADWAVLATGWVAVAALVLGGAMAAARLAPATTEASSTCAAPRPSPVRPPWRW